MNDRRAVAAGGLTALTVLATYAVVAGIAPTPVSGATPRIPGLLFAVILPGVVAVCLGAGVVWLHRRFDLRAPMVSLVVGAVIAAIMVPTAGEAWLLVLGGPAWFALLAGLELVGRWWSARQTGTRLVRTERAAVVGVSAGLTYWLVFVAAAVAPAWANPEPPGGPGPVEAVLTVGFLAGAFCLLIGVPVAFARHGGPYTPLVVPALWVGYDVVSGWQFYDAEAAVLAFTLGWPAAVALVAALAAIETAARRGWQRFRVSANL